MMYQLYLKLSQIPGDLVDNLMGELAIVIDTCFDILKDQHIEKKNEEKQTNEECRTTVAVEVILDADEVIKITEVIHKIIKKS